MLFGRQFIEDVVLDVTTLACPCGATEEQRQLVVYEYFEYVRIPHRVIRLHDYFLREYVLGYFFIGIDVVSPENPFVGRARWCTLLGRVVIVEKSIPFWVGSPLLVVVLYLDRA